MEGQPPPGGSLVPRSTISRQHNSSPPRSFPATHHGWQKHQPSPSNSSCATSTNTTPLPLPPPPPSPSPPTRPLCFNNTVYIGTRSIDLFARRPPRLPLASEDGHIGFQSFMVSAFHDFDARRFSSNVEFKQRFNLSCFAFLIFIKALYGGCEKYPLGLKEKIVFSIVFY